MPIAFSCQSCGRSLKVKDELAGKQIYCPDCKSILYVPTASESPGPVDALPATAAAAEERDPYGERAEPPPKEPVRKPRFRDEDDWDARGERQRMTPAPKPAGASDGGGVGTIIGGIVMMVVALIWFFGAWIFFNTIFIYPPILFIIGLVAIFKGIYSAATGKD